MKQPIHLLFITIIIYSLFSTFVAQNFKPSSSPSPSRPGPSANTSTKWTNSPSLQTLPKEYPEYDDVTARVILLRVTSGPVFGCGFICSGSCKSFLFSIFIESQVEDGSKLTDYGASPRIVWSANRDRTVQENATLEFSQNGNLILVDVDGTQVWSTDTSAKSVVDRLKY